MDILLLNMSDLAETWARLFDKGFVPKIQREVCNVQPNAKPFGLVIGILIYVEMMEWPFLDLSPFITCS